MAAARILLSSLVASAAAAHGGPVVARRHAAALVRHGFEVCIAAPRGERHEGDSFAVHIYQTGVAPDDRLGFKRFDAKAVEELSRLVARFRPDVVYDVHGAPWAVDAAARHGVPVVSMMGDYNWFCENAFLVTSRGKRCAGPASRAQCFACVNKWRRWYLRPFHRIARPAAAAGVVKLKSWDGLNESMDYMAEMRGRISTFIVGDRKAHEFLVEQGVRGSRVARIQQSLPDSALRVRRSPSDAQFSSRRLRFAFVGRADLDKGLRVLAHAFDSLPPELPVDLWIVHAREARADYLAHLFPSRRRFARDLESGRIRLLRPDTQEDVFDLMAQADIGVVPSIAFESPCLAMLEFVAQRTPIVRSESAGMEHVIQDGVNGRTFPYGDSGALARVIREIVADRAIIGRWRSALPPIGRDDEYVRQLARVFESFRTAGGPDATPTRELAHA